MKKRNMLICSAIALLSLITGAAGAFLFLLSTMAGKAPAGPAQVPGWEGAYYNWTYNAAPCPDATPMRYEDGNISFFYYSAKDCGGGERKTGSHSPPEATPEKLLGYKSIPGPSESNINVGMAKPDKSGPATKKKLEAFALAHARERLKGELKTKKDFIPGSFFSMLIKSGAREVVYISAQDGTLYFFTDHDMPMQRGDYRFMDALGYAVGFRAFSLDDYPSFGLKRWFSWPAWEKHMDCNFDIMVKTLSVNRKTK
ncbi:MAG TPA: hypothetical protein DDW67_08250 [Elusimicrobia bacterium]|nr:hypothetical protein [Elusimicrobiota bacterium]